MPVRFSGHETFPCRYSWLPKAYRALNESLRALSDDEAAMVELGVGKNMVRSARFWLQATGVAEPAAAGGYELTEFAHMLLGPNGFDPFLEDIRTLWLIHWKLSTSIEDPLFAWDYLFNHWLHPELSRTEVIKSFRREADRLDRPLSIVTLEQHFDIFLHTYVPTRNHKGKILEDNLDCPLIELELIHQVGERTLENTERREPVYAFRREAKLDISPELFVFCVHEFWDARFAAEQTLSFREVALSHGSPGQIFKLPEWDIRKRLETIEADSNGAYLYQESAAMPQIQRTSQPLPNFLALVYHDEGANA